MAFGITASGAVGHGDANSFSVTQENTEVTAGNTLALVSGGDATLSGAVAAGQNVIADVGGNLTIQSLQDTTQSHSSQQEISASATIGYGASVSASFSHETSSSSSAIVGQQSEIEAGNGGFKVDVGGNTNLVGGLISAGSEAVADNLNSLTTGTLTTSNVQNTSEASAGSTGLGGSFNLGNSATLNGADGANSEANSSFLAANGSHYGAARAAAQNIIDNGSASSSAGSTTESAVSAGRVTIANSAGQFALTGEGDAAILAGLSTDTSASNPTISAPDVATIEQAAADQQIGNNLAFNIATSATDPVGRAANSATIYKVTCSTAGKVDCQATPTSDVNVPQDGTVIVFNNGIFNSLPGALNNGAAQVAEATQGQVNEVFYAVYNPYTGNPLSELLYAGYDSLNNHFGGLLPVTQAELDDQNIGQAAEDQGAGLVLVSHSRGGFTASVAIQDDPGAFASLQEVALNGSAANGQDLSKVLGQNDIGATVVTSIEPNDLVGTGTASGVHTGSALVGGNSPTGQSGGACPFPSCAHETYGAWKLPNGVNADALAAQGADGTVSLTIPWNAVLPGALRQVVPPELSGEAINSQTLMGATQIAAYNAWDASVSGESVQDAQVGAGVPFAPPVQEYLNGKPAGDQRPSASGWTTVGPGAAVQLAVSPNAMDQSITLSNPTAAAPDPNTSNPNLLGLPAVQDVVGQFAPDSGNKPAVSPPGVRSAGGGSAAPPTIGPAAYQRCVKLASPDVSRCAR